MGGKSGTLVGGTFVDRIQPTLPPRHKDAEGKSVAYISVDATGVGQQGPGGKRAEGKMAYVGMVDNPVPDAKERWANAEAKRRPEWKARSATRLKDAHPRAAEASRSCSS